MKHLLAFLLIMFSAAPALAQPAADEAAVRAVIAEWYERVGHQPADRPYALFAPGSIDGGPGYAVPADLNSGSAAIRGPWINRELAAQALVFAYDIDELVVAGTLAKAEIWERAYFFASKPQTTYERGARAMFVFEKQPNGEWKILAHEASSQGIPPNKITTPMPDLRDLYYQRCGPACDPAKDAAATKQGW